MILIIDAMRRFPEYFEKISFTERYARLKGSPFRWSSVSSLEPATCPIYIIFTYNYSGQHEGSLSARSLWQCFCEF